MLFLLPNIIRLSDAVGHSGSGDPPIPHRRLIGDNDEIMFSIMRLER